MSLLLVNSNALNIPLADGSVSCCITSPPYYGLRDYGTAKWEGGDSECNHLLDHVQQPSANSWAGTNNKLYHHPFKDTCGKCGAVRIDNQIGLEQSPEEYVSKMVEVFREVRRVLRDDGSVWLVLGDSYVGGKGQSGSRGAAYQEKRNNNGESLNKGYQTLGGAKETRPTDDRAMLREAGLKPKDLIGIPWRVALALQADGWWLRSDIIWSKNNPMPESVKDRPTKSHEYVFLLTKSARYYYDADAVKIPSKQPEDNRGERGNRKRFPTDKVAGIRGPGIYPMANLRSVWTIPTQSYSGAHFATYPEKLVEPCIKAGTSEKGCCPECGSPWKKKIKTNNPSKKANTGIDERYESMTNMGGNHQTVSGLHRNGNGVYSSAIVIGWQPTCTHNAEPVPCVILDPFVGSGTTLLVARNLGRSAIGLDLSYTYLHDQASKRLELDKLKKWTNALLP